MIAVFGIDDLLRMKLAKHKAADDNGRYVVVGTGLQRSYLSYDDLLAARDHFGRLAQEAHDRNVAASIARLSERGELAE